MAERQRKVLERGERRPPGQNVLNVLGVCSLPGSVGFAATAGGGPRKRRRIRG